MKDFLKTVGLIVFWAIVIIMLNSCCSNCNSSSNTPIDTLRQMQRERITYNVHTQQKDGAEINYDYIISVYRFEYDGHSYIMFCRGDGKGVVHDPNCKCHSTNAVDAHNEETYDDIYSFQ